MNRKSFTPQNFLKKNLGGFTMIELFVVVSIIVLLSLIILPNYRASVSQLTLERSAHKMAQDIRRAAEMAMSAKEWQGQIPSGGYGVHLELSWETYYKLYADKNGSQKYEGAPPDKEVETINLEKGVVIQGISTTPNKVSINFKPPAPVVNLGFTSDPVVTITLALKSDSTKTRTIKVNRAGLIDVE